MDTNKLLEQAKKRHDEKEAQDAAKYGYAPRQFAPRIRFFKRLGVFKASNVEFNPKTFVATSYRWWNFVEKIGNKVVFNSYRYSPSTGQHQRKVETLLNQLGIKVDVYIDAPQGLQRLESAVSYYEREISKLKAQIANPKSRKAKNIQRERQIRALTEKLKQAKKLAEIRSAQILAG